MNKFLLMMLAGLLLVPSLVLAAPTLEELQAQIAEIAEQLEEMDERIEPAERHTALDRIQWYGDLRTKVDTLHYNDVTWNPGINFDVDALKTAAFDPTGAWQTQLTDIDGTLLDYSNLTEPGTSVSGALGGDTRLTPLSQMLLKNPNFLGLLGASGTIPISLSPTGGPKTYDINNDLFYTTRLRLSMRAKIADNMQFQGRLSMYKNWGDSVGTKVFDSWGAFTMDGTNGGNTTGDMLRVERAMFNWKHIGGTPLYLSIGRRPSTYGAPGNYRDNVKRGGTPSSHLVHFNFDGITIGYGMEDLTGLEGSVIRFCYGQGFESEWGNGELYGNQNQTDDTHLGGFNIDAYNDGTTLIQLTAFRAMDVVDGFKGTFAFPAELNQIFAPGIWSDTQAFPNINFVTRYTPSTTIGDINLFGANFSREEDNGFVWFGSVGMTQLESNGKAGMFGGLGNDAVFNAAIKDDGSGDVYFKAVEATDSDTNEGYGVYVGIQVPAPMGKFGVEYNYGSEYWSPFTQSQDDVMGSKLATRGHAGEADYIFEINRNAFLKVGGIYYDYEYTGSGSPVGKPQDIDDVKDGTAYSLLPAVDTAWDAYASMNLKW
jgi:Protein of unknown function (DUF3373)